MKNKIKRVILGEKFEYILLVLILLLSFGVRLYKVNSPIADWHSWRQVDTASVARIYVDSGIDIFHPKYYDISSIQTGYFNPEGLRFVEFPIYNIIHAASFLALPQISFEVWGRLISIFASIITGFAVYKIGKHADNKWVGLASAFFFGFIPFNIYFSRVILPEPLATCFGVLSVWLFIAYTEKNSKLSLYLSAISFAAAILIKPYAGFYALAILFLALRKYGIKGIFKNIHLLLALDIALIPFLLWRVWINQGTNFVGVPHLKWAFNGDGIRFRPAFWRWIFGERLGNLILGMWGLLPFGAGLMFKSKKGSAINWMGLGMVLYVVIVATASVRHDYYQTIVIPAIALILGRGAVGLWNSKEFNKIGSRLVLLFSIFMMFGMGAYQIKEFYKVNHPEFMTVGRIVDETLPKDAQLIVPDNGNTVFLYHTRRFGWPVMEAGIDDAIKKGADYFVSVNNDADTNMLKNKFEIFSQGDNFTIIDLHKPKK